MTREELLVPMPSEWHFDQEEEYQLLKDLYQFNINFNLLSEDEWTDFPEAEQLKSLERARNASLDAFERVQQAEREAGPSWVYVDEKTGYGFTMYGNPQTQEEREEAIAALHLHEKEEYAEDGEEYVEDEEEDEYFKVEYVEDKYKDEDEDADEYEGTPYFHRDEDEYQYEDEDEDE